MSKTAEQIQKELAEPFPASAVKWLPGKLNKDESKALAFAYITSPEVMNRLDAVVGIGGWRATYRPGPAGGVICELSLRIDGEWVTKEDVGENTDFQAVKGGISDALKRAAVAWGIGRYLRKIPVQWVPCEKRGNVVYFTAEPSIPREFLPGGKPMQEPQPRQPEPEGTDQLPDGGTVDKATGEIHEAPVAAEPPRQPAPAGDLQTEWNMLCRLMQTNKLNSQMVGQALGGNFNKNAFETWLERGTNRSAQVLIDEIVSDRSRAAAVTG